MSTSTTDRVILCGMNSVAVTHLMNGRFHTACEAFTTAIEISQALLQRNVDCTPEDLVGLRDEQVQEEAPPTSSHQIFETIFLPDLQKEEGPENESCMTVDGTFVYRRAILLQTDQAIPALKTICIVLLFNMGLGFHLHNSIEENCSPYKLEKASAYYTLALRLYSAQDEQDFFPPVIWAVILNNLGELSFQRGQSILLRDIYLQLHRLWNHVAFSPELLNEKEMNGLILNMINLKVADLAAAA